METSSFVVITGGSIWQLSKLHYLFFLKILFKLRNEKMFMLILLSSSFPPGVSADN